MAANKLSAEQRNALLLLLAAGYDSAIIRDWFEKRGWPWVSRRTLSFYRERNRAAIERLRAERHAEALTTGLALKAERVARLKAHADELEKIKWQPDKRGRLWNEKAWRETLDDIAREMGERRTIIDLRYVREQAEKIAEATGLDPAAVLAEAERIVKEWSS